MFDEAGNMSGVKNGVQALIKQDENHVCILSST